MSAETRTVLASLSRAAEAWPDRPALVFDDAPVTYRQLEHLSRAYLGELQQLDIGAGDTVLVMLNNSPDFVGVWLALASGGYVEVPVNIALVGETLSHVIRDSGARLILTEPEFVDRIVDSRSDLLDTIAILGESSAVDAGPLQMVTVRPGDRIGVPVPRRELDEVAVMYTSGTTGPSKGAVISERHAYEYASAAAQLVELREGDVYYAPLPLFHIAGQWAVVYACIQSGACAVLKRRFSNAAFWDDVRGHGVSVSFLLGAMAQFLLNSEPAATDPDNPLDRVMMVPLVEDVDRFRERFAVRVSTCFGSTESNVPLASDFAASMATGAGRPRAGFDVRLVDADGGDVAPGGTGELLVRAHEPGVTLLRYLGNEEATSNAIRDGWLHTGDVFRLDAEGNYHFSDRLKDSLRKRGENISSFEVEREIQSHPAVQFCAVVGVDSEYSEQEIAAFVQLVPGGSVTEDEIRAHVAARAPKFMVPDQVIFVDGFSLTATGKIQKFPLREKLEG